MTNANVKLSNAELLLVCDEQFILTKNRIINKVYQLFGDISKNFIEYVKNKSYLFPEEILKPSPKIFRGENYRSLPYVMLDYPRFFSKEKTLAIRCFFWWGNFFSLTLHLGGMYSLRYQGTLQMLTTQTNDWYVCINENEWEHHFDKENYLSTKDYFSLSNKRLPGSKSFLKIAKKISLQRWDEAYDFFILGYTEMLDMLEACGK